MAFTSILDSSDAKFGNIVFAYDVDIPSHPNYVGVAFLVDGLGFDQFMLGDTDLNFSLLDPQEIPNPFIETAGLEDGD